MTGNEGRVGAAARTTRGKTHRGLVVPDGVPVIRECRDTSQEMWR